MDIFQAITLSIVQGLTEFLPISSSGHLVLFQKTFLLPAPPIFFDTALHFGTLFAVIFYLRKDLFSIMANLKENKKFIGLIVLGTVPAALFGFFFKEQIERTFDSYTFLGIGFLITAIMLGATFFFKKNEKRTDDISWFDSLFIGTFQAFSILSSISRSGATIAASLFRKLDRETAFKFSFFLFIPAILGALALQLFDINDVPKSEINFSILGFFISGITGFFTLKILKDILVKGRFFYFAIYCTILGIMILVFLK